MLLLLATAIGCAPTEPVARPEAGVPRALAVERAERIEALHYDVHLSIPADHQEPIRGRITARFNLTDGALPLAFDFAQEPANVLDVRVQGVPVDYRVEAEHVAVPADVLSAGKMAIEIDFLAGDGSLNRHDEYLYTLFVPDRARVALPVFDQPDLKATWSLELEVPSGWKAVANGALEHRSESGNGERATLVFARTRPLPTYLFAFAAGALKVVEAQRGGRTLRMLHRETDDAKVARNLEAIFDLHAAALDWLEDYTGIDYPFAKLDFAALPAFQYGGMEHAGAIFYRDRSLFLDETATQGQYLGRASLIAHEVAHMWFGNLVTMEWFDDVWMKEVFANFMAAKIVNPSFPEVDHDLRFLLAHYPRAYGVDRTAGANPIRQPLDNLDEAGSLYGAIIYQKAPVVMKHLELLVGEERFRDGMRRYLASHAYANATWLDLVAILDELTGDDLREWSRLWVEEAGRPTVTAHFEANGGSVDSIRVEQTDPAGASRLWNQRLQMLLGRDSGPLTTVPLHLREAAHEIDISGSAAPDYVLVNGEGVGYGNFRLDPASRDHLLRELPGIDAPLVRAVAWLSLWDGMLDGLVASRDLLELAVRALPEEADELNVERILDDVVEINWRYLGDDERQTVAPRLEETLWRGLTEATESTLKSSYFAAYRDVALTDVAIDRLERIWSGDEAIEGLTLSENDTIRLGQQLAIHPGVDGERVLRTQRERIENPDSLARFDFVRPALSSDPAVRDAFFASLSGPAEREHEPWVLEALRFLHHPMRAAAARRYVEPSLEMLEEIQATGDIFFPLGWASATLSGHASPEAADIVRAFLDASPDLPPRLRGKLLQAADPLFRAVEIRGSD